MEAVIGVIGVGVIGNISHLNLHSFINTMSKSKKKTKKSRSKKSPEKRKADGDPGGSDCPAGGGGGWSWGGAFAAASSIQHVGCLEPTDDGGTADDGAAGRAGTAACGFGLAELARDHAPSARPTGRGAGRKRPRPDDAADGSDGGGTPPGGGAGTDEEEEEDAPLEGRMVAAGEEQVLVLVDRGRGVVYSSELRADDGERLAIGTLVDGEVVLDESRLTNSATGSDDRSEKKVGPTEPFPYDGE